MTKTYKHRSDKLHTTRKQVHKLKEPNPLNLLELRRLTVPSPHFEYISISLTYNLEDSVNNWIKDHLKGRYYLGKSVGIADSSQIGNCLKIGFESPKEMSYFVLACPHLKYK
jgi:hypothetical protein